MELHSEGLDLLRDGIVLPHFRILSFFLKDILKDSYRVLDINSHGGQIFEMINVLCPKNINYVGIDEDPIATERAKNKKLQGTFKNMEYDKMKLRSNSYDLIIAQNQFLKAERIMDQVDNLFRASRKWIVFFNLLVLPECDGTMKMDVDGKQEEIFGVSYLRELLSIMEPTHIEYSFIVKTENPIKPTPSIFVIKK